MTRHWSQVVLLGRTFFARLFESDLMPPGLPQVQLVIWSMMALASPGLFLVMMFTPKYGRLQMYPGQLGPAIATDRLTLFTLTMIAVGFAALMTWDGVFPDRRDARILSPLPVRTATLVVARLGALTALFALCATAAIALPGLFFPLIASAFVDRPGPLRGTLALIPSLTAAAAFVFFSLIAVQCTLLAVFGRRIAHRLAVVLQLIFTMGLLQMALLMPTLAKRVRGPAVALDWITGQTRVLPPVWFYALNEWLAGSASPEAYRLARFAALATAAVVCGALALYALSYRRLTRQAIETPPDSNATHAAAVGLRALASMTGLAALWRRGSPVERAVAGFTLRTLARSRQHRMLLAIYIALGLTLAIVALLPTIVRGLPVDKPGEALGSATPVLIFFTVAGMRALFTIPVEPRAAWAFRVREPLDRHAAVNGVRRALLAAGVAPYVMLTLAALTPLWGFAPALRHAIFCTIMGLLLVEILLRGTRSIPFTCTYYPFRNGFRRWPAYFFGFTTYAYTITAVELGPLASTTAFTIAMLGVLAATAALSRARARQLAALPSLTFAEEDPDALFAGFNLSESLAAKG